MSSVGVLETLEAFVDCPDDWGVVPHELLCAHTPREPAEAPVRAEEGGRSPHESLKPFILPSWHTAMRVFKRTLCKINAHGHPLYIHIQQYTRTLSMPKFACSAPSTVCSLNKPQKHKSKKRPTTTRICAHAYPGSSIQPACITSCWMQQILVNERESI